MTNELQPTNRETVYKDLFIADNLIKELTSQRKTIAVAEGCTGGSILNRITVPGATKVFRNGVIVYSQEAKKGLGVKKETMDQYGEYSPEVVIEMAKQVRRLRNDNLAISTVGEVGSSNPHSWVHIGYAFDNGDAFSQSMLIGNEGKALNKSMVANTSLVNGLMMLTDRKRSLVSVMAPLLPEMTNPFATEKLTDLSRQLVTFLRHHQMTISTIESCTGGAIADVITNSPGSSKVFNQGWVVYDENAKIMLGVPLSALSFGQVYSPQVSMEMALALRRKTNTDIVISTTGTMDIMDRRPYHGDTPPGTIYYSIIVDGHVITKCLKIEADKRYFMKTKITEHILIDLLSSLYASHNIFFKAINQK